VAPPIAYNPVGQSSFVDFTGYRITDATTAEAAYNITDGRLFNNNSEYGFDVALVLPRVQEPTALLAGDWGSRQLALKALNDSGSLWSTFGADQTQFDNTVDFLRNDLHLTVLDSNNSNYVTSAESRTIWVYVETQAQWQGLFNTPLYYSDGVGIPYWNGNLSLPTQVTVDGLWFDRSIAPPGSSMASTPVTLPNGAQSIGNSAGPEPTNLAPQDMAALYNFPLDGKAVQTVTVGLIEPGIGSALKNDNSGSQFQSRLTTYLDAIGQNGQGLVHVQGQNGQQYDIGAGERSLDVGVVAAVNPNSDIVLFNGSGLVGYNTFATTYTAIQSATFEKVHPVAAWSDSFGDAQSMAPGSPFYQAYWDLFVDAALANQTAISALGDGGSGNETGNGLTNLEYNCTQPYGLLVGGSSLSVLGGAITDPTLLDTIVAPALAGDRDVIWRLIEGGLTALPTNMQATQFFVETAWNWYSVGDGQITSANPGFPGGYLSNTATSGGVDPTQPVPSYQLAYGLNPVTSDPLHQSGRGAPDVTANAGGNATYYVPGENMEAYGYDYGTSAASPLWMGLIAQIDTIFNDQGLPNLGYMNDLLYIASAIAPAAFNDVTLGNNISSWVSGGTTYTSNDEAITPTGFGYYAGPGYDLVSGLGSPNGLLLARALTTIGHSQISFRSNSDMLDDDGAQGWTSGADQSLLFQAMSGNAVTASVSLGSQGLVFAGGDSGHFAWTSRFAQQSLQDDFDPQLVRMYDKQAAGWTAQSVVASGDRLSVTIDGVATHAVQGTLTSPFGFADFLSGDGAVRAARPVAVAETVGGDDDQVAIVRVRQNGENDLSLSFYRVDDLSGAIAGRKPGEAGYAALAEANTYQLTTGGTTLHGPGYGNFLQAGLIDVDANDLIAMKLTNLTTGQKYWAFSTANESVAGEKVGHLWNFGLNTWGWEDTHGGGDRDFNDLIVGFDFTSASGHAWLV
jgi:hypothetical protein